LGLAKNDRYRISGARNKTESKHLAIWDILAYFAMAMHTKVIKLDTNRLDLAKIKQAAQVVQGGRLAAFPTETVYGIACRVRPEPLTNLDKVKGRRTGKFYTLHIAHRGDVEKYVPQIGLRAQKLIENAWPGPLTIVFQLDAQSIKRQMSLLEREVFENLYKNNSIGIRCPDNPVAAKLLESIPCAVVAPSANVTGQQPAIEAAQVLRDFAGQIDLVLDGGRCKYGQNSTVVKIGKPGLEVLREGVYSRDELETMSKIKFLFVCTGNTCRSPMAEGMFRKYLSEKLKCKVDQLEEMGYTVSSAGTLDIEGVPASPESIAACAVKGIDIRAHASRVLSEQLIHESDFIFAMSRMHVRRVLDLSPEAASKCMLLAEKTEIPDPIGQPRDVYDRCAQLIEEAVKKRMSGFVL